MPTKLDRYRCDVCGMVFDGRSAQIKATSHENLPTPKHSKRVGEKFIIAGWTYAVVRLYFMGVSFFSGTGDHTRLIDAHVAMYEAEVLSMPQGAIWKRIKAHFSEKKLKRALGGSRAVRHRKSGAPL